MIQYPKRALYAAISYYEVNEIKDIKKKNTLVLLSSIPVMTT